MTDLIRMADIRNNHISEIYDKYDMENDDIRNNLIIYKTNVEKQPSIEDEAFLSGARLLYELCDGCDHEYCMCKCELIDQLDAIDYLLSSKKIIFKGETNRNNFRGVGKLADVIFNPCCNNTVDDPIKVLVKSIDDYGNKVALYNLDRECLRIKAINSVCVFYILYPGSNYIQYAISSTRLLWIETFVIKLGGYHPVVSYNRIDFYEKGDKEYIPERRYLQTKSARK